MSDAARDLLLPAGGSPFDGQCLHPHRRRPPHLGRRPPRPISSVARNDIGVRPTVHARVAAPQSRPVPMAYRTPLARPAAAPAARHLPAGSSRSARPDRGQPAILPSSDPPASTYDPHRRGPRRRAPVGDELRRRHPCLRRRRARRRPRDRCRPRLRPTSSMARSPSWPTRSSSRRRPARPRPASTARPQLHPEALQQLSGRLLTPSPGRPKMPRTYDRSRPGRPGAARHG